MELDKYKQAKNLLAHIAWNEDKVRSLNDYLGGHYDKVSGTVKRVLGDDYDYSRLENAVKGEVKAYRDRLENEIEQLKKEFEEL